MSSSELLDFDVAALSKKIRSRQISPVELVEAYLDRHGVPHRRVPNQDGGKSNLIATIRPAIEGGVAYTATSGVPAEFYLHAWRLETGTQIIMLWDRLNTSRGFLRLRTPGAAPWLHEPDGPVRPVSGFDGTGRTIGKGLAD